MECIVITKTHTIPTAKKNSLHCLAILLFVFFSQQIFAGMIDKDGMAPYEICGLCHNLDGISFTAKFPKLAGQKPEYITKQFLAFSREERSNDGGQMVAITTEVEMGTLDDIAAYFASLPPPPAVEPEAEPAVLASGKVIYTKGKEGVPACITCHGLVDSKAPWIYAQHQNYLIKQLNDFKSEDRANDGGVMKSIAELLSDDEIDAVSAYVESIQPRVAN